MDDIRANKIKKVGFKKVDSISSNKKLFMDNRSDTLQKINKYNTEETKEYEAKSFNLTSKFNKISKLLRLILSVGVRKK